MLVLGINKQEINFFCHRNVNKSQNGGLLF